MDFDKIIRSFLGFRDPFDRKNDEEEYPGDGGGHGHFGFFGPGLPPSRSGDDHDDDDDGHDGGPDGFPRGRGGILWGGGGGGLEDFADMDKQMQDMFQHFEEMFKNFGLSDFHTNIPSIETTPNRRRISPRDEMLKQPDEQKEVSRPDSDPRQPNNRDSPVRFGDVFRSPWHWNIPAMPSNRHEDRDLDDQVKAGRLDDILKPRNQQPQQPHFKSFSKSISIQTVRKPDGTIEQRRTETDSDGNVTSTITTSDDSQNPAMIQPPAMFNRPSIWPGHQSPTYEDSQKDSLFDKFFGSWRR